MTLELLKTALANSWSRDTAYRSDSPSWSESNRELGQCAVTALIVQDYFGGDILRGYSSKYRKYHYWNSINGHTVDLTISQFSGIKGGIDFESVGTKRRSELLRASDVKDRYLILKDRVDAFLKSDKLILGEEEIL